MATGYTVDVQSGKIETLHDYALGCARAFGALIMMRDDAKDAPIPKEFEPEVGYHKDQLAAAEAILAEELTAEDAERMALAEHEKALSSFAESKLKNEEHLARYESMLAKVRDWIAPTKEHQELKNFMVEQLESSIEFDIYESDAPIKQTGSEWLENRLRSASRDVKYHSQKITEEIKRTENRNKWISDLRQSLEAN